MYHKGRIAAAFLLYFLSCFITVSAQTGELKKKTTKGTLYFSWGYNKDWFSRSDLHFTETSNETYDFTLYDVKAVDRPGFEQIFGSDISIPQFIYRFGYYFNDKRNLGIEIGFDHAKYVMVANQKVHVKGVIHEKEIDKDTVLSPGFLAFEHTNGANFLMVSLMKRKPFYRVGQSVFNLVLKPGAGIVIPKTDVALFGKHRDNEFHIAGYIAGLDVSLRYEYGRHLFAETGFKGCYANYMNVLTIGDAKANHHFFSLEYLLSIGYGIAL